MTVLMAAVLAVLLPSVSRMAQAQYDGEVMSPQARAIASKLACPVCEGQPITESNADVAANMRRRVQEMVDQGYTEQQILDEFVENFGVGILRDPPKEGVALGLWVAPPLVLVAGGGIVLLALRRWRRQENQPVTIDELMADDEAEARVESELRPEGRG
jgi:cytochrome c-type biogenesis protein CcmH